MTKSYSDLCSNLKKAQYVWEMARYKERIKPETKQRLKAQFDEAVLELAACIEWNQQLVTDMEEYKRITHV